MMHGDGCGLCRFDGLTKPVLFETTLMGPQLLRDAYGADSVQLKTLIQMATNMVADLRSKLQAAYEDRVLVQVSSVDTHAGMKV
jgi:hypothetical protein